MLNLNGLECINVNILVVALHYSFASCYHWMELGKRYIGLFCSIFNNCMRIYNDLKIKVPTVKREELKTK